MGQAIRESARKWRLCDKLKEERRSEVCDVFTCSTRMVLRWSMRSWELPVTMLARMILIGLLVSHSFERFVCSEAVTNENLWILISPGSGLGIKDRFEPLCLLNQFLCFSLCKDTPFRYIQMSLYSLCFDNNSRLEAAHFSLQEE